MMFKQQKYAASCPCSKFRFSPSFPFINWPSDLIGSCPEIYIKFPIFLCATYEPTGFGAFGKSMFNDFSFYLTLIFF